MTKDDVHSYPVNDIIAHEVDGEECPCGPTTTPVERADGSFGWHIMHHSLDGREFREPLGDGFLEEKP